MSLRCLPSGYPLFVRTAVVSHESPQSHPLSVPGLICVPSLSPISIVMVHTHPCSVPIAHTCPLSVSTAHTSPSVFLWFNHIPSLCLWLTHVPLCPCGLHTSPSVFPQLRDPFNIFTTHTFVPISGVHMCPRCPPLLSRNFSSSQEPSSAPRQVVSVSPVGGVEAIQEVHGFIWGRVTWTQRL